MIVCPNCDGAGFRFNAAVAHIRRKAVAFVECLACVGTGVFPPGYLAPSETGPGVRLRKGGE